MRSVSRARSGRTSRLGPSASAARISARAVSDLEPGSPTTASTGAVRCGVVQTSFTGTVCPVGVRPHRRHPGQPAAGFEAFFAGSTRVSLRLANSNMPSSESSRP